MRSRAGTIAVSQLFVHSCPLLSIGATSTGSVRRAPVLYVDVSQIEVGADQERAERDTSPKHRLVTEWIDHIPWDITCT